MLTTIKLLSISLWEERVSKGLQLMSNFDSLALLLIISLEIKTVCHGLTQWIKAQAHARSSYMMWLGASYEMEEAKIYLLTYALN